jgi:hypothetical protein
VLFFDPTWILIMVISTLLGFATQGYVNRTYRKWSNVPISTGEAGAQVARRVLDSEGLGSVTITQIPGSLTDHYDPRSKNLGLSSDVYAGRSVAAAGVAAHEAGHALQDAKHYVWGNVRSALVPAANLGSRLAWVLIIVGFFLRATGLVWAGVAFFAAAVLFQVVTLPVEFNASKRALVVLAGTGRLDEHEVSGARQVLTAAALTYVAATLISILQLLYYVGLARRN